MSVTDKHEREKWLVWWPYQGETVDGAESIEANSPRDAVEAWAQREDARGDYIIIGGTEADVCVCPAEDKTKVLRFVVVGEAVPHYTARLALDTAVQVATAAEAAPFAALTKHALEAAAKERKT